MRCETSPGAEWVLDPFSCAAEEGEEEQYIKTLGSYALTPDASEVALGAALSIMHTHMSEGSRYRAVIFKLRVFGLPESRLELNGEDYSAPFTDTCFNSKLYDVSEDKEERRMQELERSAMALKFKFIAEYKRDALAKIQLMGDTWAKVRMTLGQLDPLPGRVAIPKAAKDKKRARVAEAASDD